MLGNVRRIVQKMSIFLLACLPGWALATATPPAAPAMDEDRLETQRAIFRKAYPKARAGTRSAVDDNRVRLADYPLLPYLEAAWLRARIDKVDGSTVQRFLDSHPDLAETDRLRRRWALSLAKRGRHKQYLALYQAHYARDGDDAELACHALDARLKLRRPLSLADDAIDLWLVGKSQPDACDDVFAWLDEQGHLTTALRRKRLRLALDNFEFSLARYLARGLHREDVEKVEAWVRMRSRPDRELAKAARLADRDDTRRLLLVGLKRLASRKPDEATAWMDQLERQYRFDADDVGAVRHRIAVWSARKQLPAAQDRLHALDSDYRDDEASAWAARSAMLAADWPAALAALGHLSDDAAASAQWRYWRARGLEATGQTEAATDIYRSIAGERGFYGFLSADRLELPYTFSHQPADADEALIARLAVTPDLLRARELFLVNLHGTGRREWEHAMSRLDEAERGQAAILAHRWGWHSRAIRAAVRNGLGDDLDIVYPMPFEPLFAAGSQRAGIASPWVYGIARSESLFMPDVASHAGALGLMQLMPATGRDTARRAGISYRGRYSLLDPETNVALGTTYLGWMYERFGASRVLATAAYNAGPHRVKAWLPEVDPVPADVWIEAIPFTETRKYVRRVLTADAIFHWRSTGQSQRLASLMAPVSPPGAAGRRLATN